MILAQNVDTKQIFGTINPPPGSPTGNNALGVFLSTGINLFILVAALAAFAYLLWGALDWITSGGDKEKLLKARGKIQNAVIGLMVVFAALIIFNLIVGFILGGKIIQSTGTGFQFNIPQSK